MQNTNQIVVGREWGNREVLLMSTEFHRMKKVLEVNGGSDCTM